MGNKSYGLTALIVACVIALIVGAGIGYAYMPKKVTTITKEIQLPAIEIIKEVPKEVEIIKEVPLNAKDTYLDPALKDFIKEASDDDDFVYCEDEEYDEDQIKLKSDPNNWKVEIGKDETLVSFDAKLKYLDKDVQEKCYAEYEVEVLYEDDEDPQVEFSLI